MPRNKKIQAEENNEETITINDINFKKLIPNVIDNYLISIIDGHHTIVLPMHTTGTQFKSWTRGKGGIFSKDVLNYSLGKTLGKYILIKDKKEKTIVRIIEENEELQFKTLKLIDGQIKDKSYMILFKIQNGEKLSNTQRYINEKDIEPIEDIRISPSAKTSYDDDYDYHARSISLFNE